jgi:hypothetical protein
MHYPFEKSPTVDELLALRPEPSAAVAQSLAVTEIQERILNEVILSGPDGLGTAELSDRLDEPFTHVQRVANGLLYERRTEYKLIKKHTKLKIHLDDEEYGRALEDIEQRAFATESSLRKLGDSAIRTMLDMSTLDDRSLSTMARNRETITLLLANAGLPIYFRHFLDRYVSLGILQLDQRDNNFYRRLRYMQRRPLFAHIIGFTKGHNQSSYTIEPSRLDSALELGLVAPPVQVYKSVALPNPPKPPKIIKTKAVATAQPDNSTLPIKKSKISVTNRAALGFEEPAVVNLKLEPDEVDKSILLLEQLESSRAPLVVSESERLLLIKISEQYQVATRRILIDQRGNGIRMSFVARRAATIINVTS